MTPPRACVEAVRDNLAPIPLDQKMLSDFWDRVAVRSDDDCWIWTGATQGGGYGALSRGSRANRRTWIASRVSYTIHFGQIPHGMLVCHRCDVVACVNPKHLFLGTDADNQRDAISKGRWSPACMNRPKGSQVGAAKLTEQAVADIRVRVASGVSQKSLAVEYGVSRSAICMAVGNKTWRSVSTNVLNYLEAQRA